MLKMALFICSLFGLLLLGACNSQPAGDSTLDPSYTEIPYTDLVLKQLDHDILSDPGIPGCSLDDLPPFGWKEVDSGMVDVRTPEDYAIQVGSLYQEGYKNYLENRVDYPDMYQSIPEMSYEEFLATCNIFPAVDFSQHSVLGYHASASGCTVTFDKHVFRDDLEKKFIYELNIIEEGACEMYAQNRNLILVPRIPSDYSVEFSSRERKE